MSGLALARARGALEQAGLDATMALEPASSVTNDVWLSRRYAIRVNRRPHSRLLREARLASALPVEVGYPKVIASGGSLGAEWLVVERRPGAPLAQHWPDMTVAMRRRAVRQLADRLRLVHRVLVPPDLPALATTPQLLDGDRAAPAAPLLTALHELLGVPLLDRGFIQDVIDYVRRTAVALDPFPTSTLIHGDLTFENILWDGEAVSALLDFEWSRGGPPDLDLDVLLRFCANPQLHVADAYADRTRLADYEAVADWLAEDYPGLFAHRRLVERLKLYAIAFDVNDLVHHRPNRRPAELSPHHAYHRLARTLTGRSHLERLGLLVG